jgi:hypothetical protein
MKASASNDQGTCVEQRRNGDVIARHSAGGGGLRPQSAVSGQGGTSVHRRLGPRRRAARGCAAVRTVRYELRRRAHPPAVRRCLRHHPAGPGRARRPATTGAATGQRRDGSAPTGATPAGVTTLSPSGNDRSRLAVDYSVAAGLVPERSTAASSSGHRPNRDDNSSSGKAVELSCRHFHGFGGSPPSTGPAAHLPDALAMTAATELEEA